MHLEIEQNRVIDVLLWAKEQGITPTRISPSQNYVDIVSRKLVNRQKEYSDRLVWLPTMKELKRLNRKIEIVKSSTLKAILLLKGQNSIVGVSVDEGRAVLNFLSSLRNYWAENSHPLPQNEHLLAA